MSPMEPIDVLDLFPGERAALLGLLGELSEEEWRAATVCAGWSVKDVALHLLGDDVGRLSGGRDGYANPAFGGADLDVGTWEGLVTAIDRQNAAWVEGTRRMSPRLLIELLAFTGEATEAYFRSLDLMAVGGPVDWAGPAPAPVWLDVAREYTERWVHQQQIRDAVGRPGLTEGRWLGPVLGTFAFALPRALRDAPAATGAAVRLVVTGEAGGEWWGVRGEEGWRLDRAAPGGGEAAATVTMEADVAWRLFTRGIGAEQAAARVEVAGARALGARVLGMVAILA